jgi:hypothetical protein
MRTLHAHPPRNPAPTPKTRSRRPNRPKDLTRFIDDDPRDKIERVPAGGGYRILRRPRMLDSEE